MRIDKVAIVDLLRRNRERLAASGISRLSVFGSVARNDSRPDSDVDLAFVPGANFSNGGYDYFAKSESVRRELSALIRLPVDLVDEAAAKPSLKAEIDRDRIVAFE